MASAFCPVDAWSWQSRKLSQGRGRRGDALKRGDTVTSAPCENSQEKQGPDEPLRGGL